MTAEEIERTLLAVAENQVRHDEEFAMLMRSHNRFDERLERVSNIMHDLADKQLKNEERFAQLADIVVRSDARLAQLEASHQLLEQFVRDFRADTNGHFAETDQKLAQLAESQLKTDEALRALIGRNGGERK
jgi:hypothetical protein